MSLRDKALQALRGFFGSEREERDAADSPSALAQANVGPSSYNLGRGNELSGMLAVSSHLMDRFGDYECLTGDTLVHTLKGPISLEVLTKMCEEQPGLTIPLYTWDGEKITVGIGIDARQTKVDTVYSVHLDDGTIIRGTADHPFMMRDGSYKPVKELNSGDSLMPLYLSKGDRGHILYKENGDFWKSAYNSADRKSVRRVARMVAEFKNGGRLDASTAVVHIDGDVTNCDPDNINYKVHEDRGTAEWLSSVAEANAMFEQFPNLARKPLTNHKVVKIEEDGVEAVYDISVPGTHNFAVGSYAGGVFVHNSMDEYPDINCVAKGTLISVIENSVITQVPVEKLVSGGAGLTIVGYDVKKQKFVDVTANNPRLSGRDVDVIALELSNKTKLRCTPDHKIFTTERGYIDAGDLRAGETIASTVGDVVSGGFRILVNRKPTYVKLEKDPYPDGKDLVFDITTKTHNFIANGIVVHNSANHYYANDAVQPDLETGRAVWVDAPDRAVQDSANALLHKKLRIDDEIFSMAYTLVKYGNDYEELLVTDNGVVGINFLPPPSMRRVEREDGALIGFVQDPTGKFTDRMEKLRQMLGGAAEIPPHLALFEDWQVIHMRLRSTHRRSPYGHCLPASEQVMTANGPKSIKDVKVGDTVFCRHSGKLRTTKVTNFFSNGSKKIYEIKTPHRSIRASGNHPFLIKRPGKPKWLSVNDIKPGDEIMCIGKTPGITHRPPLALFDKYLTNNSLVSITDYGAKILREAGGKIGKYAAKGNGLRASFKKVNLSKKQQERLMRGLSALTLGQLKSIFNDVGLELVDGSYKLYKNSNLNLPDFITPEFCQLFGFLLGDGWISKNRQQVYFARGVDDSQNNYYENIFRNYGLEPSYQNGKAQACFNSVSFINHLLKLGWIDGAHNKRVPGWVFGLDEEYRKSFIKGFVDADGWITNQYSKTRYNIELCNKELVSDIKSLVDGLGWSCGNIREREGRKSVIKKGTKNILSGTILEEDKIVNGGKTYTITWHETELGGDSSFFFEKIDSIVECGEEPVYDIEVKDNEHNFMCNGVLSHNSVADGARWIWKRLQILEDSVLIYKLTRSPSRYAFYIDVTEIPADRVEDFLRKAKQDLKKKKIVNPRTGQLEMRYNPMANDEDFFLATRDGKDLSRVEVISGPTYQCLTGDTVIPLLDGSKPTIKELAESDNENFWVYSCDTNGNIVPGRGFNARKTGEGATIWEVELDNGEVVSCTWNHPFLTRDGKWVDASKLKPGDSLMPFNSRITSKKGGDNLDGYEKVYDPKSDKWIYTHRMVYDHINEDKGLAKNTIIHHKNGKLDNSPEQLQRLTRKEHIQLHWENVKQLHTDEVKDKSRIARQSEKSRKKMRESWEHKDRRNNHHNMMKKRMKSKKRRIIHGDILSKWNKSQERIDGMTGSLHHRWRDDVTSTEDLGLLVEKTGAKTIRQLMERGNVSQNLIYRVLRSENMAWADFAEEYIRGWIPQGRGASKKPVNYLKNKNHKVVSVRKTERREDVYDISVEGTHCFAVGQGIFLHNSMEDIEYFLRKLHAVLKVPREYLGQDTAVPARAILSNEDSRAARVTMNIQKELRNGIERLVKIDMLARGVTDLYRHDFNVMMTAPSGIYALQALEVKNARADFAARIQPYVSKNWIRKNLFNLTDDEIEAIEKELKREQMMLQQQQAQQAGGGAFASIGSPSTDLSDITPADISQIPTLTERNRGEMPTKQAIMRIIDEQRRLEDIRDRESNKRHDELLDRLDRVLRNDQQFASQQAKRLSFMSDFKSMMQKYGNRIVLPPASSGRRRRN